MLIWRAFFLLLGSNLFLTAAILAGPSLVYSTYLAGSGQNGDTATAIATDSQGNSYVTGITRSTDFPRTTSIPPGFVPSNFNSGVFVTKLSPTGSFVFSTVLGGSGLQIANAIAVDASGNIYITGNTTSADFPTVNAMQATSKINGSGGTAFVAKLNPAGTGLIYSTYLGGSNASGYSNDSGRGIAVDAAGNAYVTGSTTSADFPLVNATLTQGPSAGLAYAFAAKLNVAGSALVYSIFLGGANTGGNNSSSVGNAIALDASGNAYIGGEAGAGFPLVHPIQGTLGGGGSDGFIAKIGGNGAIEYSTFVGGKDRDAVNALAVGADGSAYVCGLTLSSDFPTVKPMQAALGSSQDAFFAKVDPSGSSLIFSSYLGGTSDDACNGISVDAAGNFYLFGSTRSPNFPLVNALRTQSSAPFATSFLAKMDAGGSQFAYSTLFGGTDASGVAFDNSGNVYIAGTTQNYTSDVPQLNRISLPQLTFAGNAHAYAAKVSDVAASQCIYYIDPTPTLPSGYLDKGTTISPNLSFLVTTNMAGCSWQSASRASWLSVTQGASGTGIGYITLQAPANPGTTALLTTLQVQDIVVTVTQRAPSHADTVPAQGLPGQIARVPITVTAEYQDNFGIVVSLNVTPVNGAPALTSGLSFQPDPSLPAPQVDNFGGPGVVKLTFKNLWPEPQGTFKLGELLVPIPSTAQLGQTYTVSAPSGLLNSYRSGPDIFPYLFVPGSANVLTVANPTPALQWLSPSSAAPVTTSVSVTVNGEGFTPASTALWNGSPRPATVNSETQLVVNLSTTDLSAAGTGQIAVSNTTPGGGTSLPLPFVVTTATPPSIGTGGVVGSADYKQKIAGGSLASIFGVNMASGPAFATSIPLPFTLNNVRVLVDGIPAALIYVSPGQINFQMPWRTLSQSQANVVVMANGSTSAQAAVPLATSVPAVYTINSQGTGQGAIRDASTGTFIAVAGSIAGQASQPGVAGQNISIYATGLGAIQDNLSDGAAHGPVGSCSPFCPYTILDSINTVANVTATIGGLPAQVTYSGLAPNFVGLYQVNAVIPQGVASGNAIPVTISINGVTSNTVTIAIR